MLLTLLGIIGNVISQETMMYVENGRFLATDEIIFIIAGTGSDRNIYLPTIYTIRYNKRLNSMENDVSSQSFLKIFSKN